MSHIVCFYDTLMVLYEALLKSILSEAWKLQFHSLKLYGKATSTTKEIWQQANYDRILPLNVSIQGWDFIALHRWGVLWYSHIFALEYNKTLQFCPWSCRPHNNGSLQFGNTSRLIGDLQIKCILQRPSYQAHNAFLEASDFPGINASRALSLWMCCHLGGLNDCHPFS